MNVVLFSVIVALAQVADPCPPIDCDAVRVAGQECMTQLFYPANYFKIDQGSSLLYNGLGNVESCKGNTPTAAYVFPMQASMQTCPMELMDAGGLFTMNAHGLCLPDTCKGTPINAIFEYALHNYNYNESAPDFPDSITPKGCIRNMQQLEDYVNQTLGCFEETHTSVCNYEEAIPDWLRDWVKENEWAKPLLDWKETIGYGECVLNRTQAMTNNPDFPFGAGQQFCCMPWTSFSGLMNTTYKGLTFLADQVNGQYGKVQGISQAKFHCENDPSGIYKSWGKDGGAVMVILFLVAIFLLIVGTNLRNRFERAGNGFGSSSSSSGGLSIRADPLYTSGDPKPQALISFSDLPGPLRVDADGAAASPQDKRLLEDTMSPDYRRPINAGAGSDADALLSDGADAVDPAQLLKEHNAKTAKLVAAVKKANPLTWRNVFDPARNVSALLEQSPARTLGGLDSLKTLSMFQIILVHSGLLTLLVGQQTSNSYLNFIAMFRSQFLISTDKAVDTFFLISGLLMAYTTINKLRKGRQSLGGAVGKTGLFTMLRFFRLVPLYGVVLMFYATILPHMGSGPIWYKMIEETGRCRQNWWTNLLFINNFHPTAFHDTCMSWTWYLANDMQFFIVGMLVLFVYVKSKFAAYGFMLISIMLSNIFGFILLRDHNDQQQDAWYDKPYMRISPMFIGMMIGMLLRDTKLVEWRLPFFKQVIAMSFAIGNLLCAIYMQYSWNRSGHEGPQSPAGNAAYQTFGRMYFVCSIACIVVLGITKNGGIVYEILSAGFWEVFGKLTFGAYLVHPIIIRGYMFSMNQEYDWNIWTQSIPFMGVLTTSYLVAMVLHVVIELPFANIVGLLFAPLLKGKK